MRITEQIIEGDVFKLLFMVIGVKNVYYVFNIIIMIDLKSIIRLKSHENLCRMLSSPFSPKYLKLVQAIVCEII